jgi:hypothetical protein
MDQMIRRSDDQMVINDRSEVQRKGELTDAWNDPGGVTDISTCNPPCSNDPEGVEEKEP